MFRLSAVLLMLAVPVLAQTTSQDEWQDWGAEDWDFATQTASTPVHGFAELALGTRVVDSPFHSGTSLQDARLRLESQYQWNGISLVAKLDGYYDGVLDNWSGRTRELSAQFTPLKNLDIKAGRQILTWGTGDYLFLNDLFPKDWQSFFAGRDDEYLKAPSDAVKVSAYYDLVNINLVWTPQFDPDNYISGDYFSFFSPWAGGLIAPQPGLSAQTPNNDEWALRLYRTIESLELAFYGYDGHHKSPKSLTETGLPTFSRLRAWGASARMPLGAGLANLEISHHQSLDDGNGDNPRIPNSQWLVLVGYEQELVTRLTGAFQFYLEHTSDYAALLTYSPFTQWETEQNRTLVTTRLTWRNATDDLSLSLFAFFSPSDEDAYLRPSLDYRLNDQWSLAGGLNLFSGRDQHSFFGQFEDNSNAWLRVRYSF
ncbi:hypothetical protein [Bowmanella dokdonensis]|uniref:Uncharacterized protein n=1 Tax=Bowmanella dokdonensis TaxID=751969 RepID=A0A939IQU9_9ALTE|nr:hypothetical protein [Bowmanella dokdonensis]MBN7824806.1 hypothetical protein [Bowmanella dokdonensis]